MSQVGTLEAGSRYDLLVGVSPDAPDEAKLGETDGAFGYCHSYETSSRYDGPGLRVVLFVSGCLLRCSYCHNPDTWHLKDGTYVSTQAVIDRVNKECRTAEIGCIDCKGLLADGLVKRLTPIWEKRRELMQKPKVLDEVINAGTKKAHAVASKTLAEVNEAMKIG